MSTDETAKEQRGEEARDSTRCTPVGVVEYGDGSVVALEEEVDGGDVRDHQVLPRRLRIERLLRRFVSANGISFFFKDQEIDPVKRLA